MGSTAYWFFIFYLLLLLLFIFYKFINAVHFTNKGPSPCKSSSKMKINFNKVVLKSLHMIIMGSGIVLIMDYITFSIGGLLVWATQWEVTSSPFPKPSPLV